MTDKTVVSKESAYRLICALLGVAAFVAYAMSKFVNGKIIVVVTAVCALGSVAALVLLVLQIRNPLRAVIAIAVFLLEVVPGSYVILFGLMFFFQDFIANETSSFFQPKSISAEAAQALVSHQVEAVELPTTDGARLRGWLVRSSGGARSPLIIYFGGSGSESSELIPYAQRLKGWSVLLVNYRGFGLSEGIPSQAHAFADALLLYDTFSTRSDVDANRIVAMGYSLGTGVAVYLAEQRPVAATILAAPYDSWSLVGLKRPPIYAPLAGTLKPYFDSISRAAAIRTPVLCLVGEADTFVPPELSRRLADQWGGQATVKAYPSEDHDLLFHDNESWADIAAFLQRLE